MNKFEHFTKEEMDAMCRGASFGLTDTYDGRFDGVSVCLSPEFYKETAANIINRALDAELVQRVVDDKSQDENKVKIGDNEYTLKKLPDGKVWTMENLREYVEGAVWNEQYNCRMYTWEHAQHVAPEGFHLPTAGEFLELALALGYLKDSEIEVAKKLQEECGFVFSGSTDDYETLGDLGSNGSFWSSTQRGVPYSYRFVFYRHSVYPIEPTDKNYRLAVRLIKD